MAKAIVFIDGTWLYSNVPRLSEAYGQQDFRLDFGKLPRVLAENVGDQSDSEVEVIRTHLFGSYASNYDMRDDEVVQRRRDFFDMLTEEYHYEIETFPVNFRGRRVRKSDRDLEDPFEPQEKCVDIAVATCIMYYAAIPNVYDIAICVVGDRDFKPVLQHVRRLGKRVAIASIRGSCPPEFADPFDGSRVKDFDIIWLDDLLHKLELKYERHQLQCQSPNHAGDRKVWTTFYPRKNQKFYCSDCQVEFANEKRQAVEKYVSSQVDNLAQNGDSYDEGETGHVLNGVVVKKVSERGYGFLKGDNTNEYFFHLTDLHQDLDFAEVSEGAKVGFEVKREPGSGKAGAARNVTLHDDE